jgi:acyl-CoA thioester hydrolase
MLNGFRFVHREDVRFRDLDAIGHVNNGTYLSYLESARIAYWLHTTHRVEQGLRALDMMLARTEIDYRTQLGWGEAVDIGVRIASMGNTSFVMQFRIEERTTRRLVAEAKKVLVHFDFGTQEKMALGEALRAQIRAQDPEVVERPG